MSKSKEIIDFNTLQSQLIHRDKAGRLCFAVMVGKFRVIEDDTGKEIHREPIGSHALQGLCLEEGEVQPGALSEHIAAEVKRIGQAHANADGVTMAQCVGAGIWDMHEALAERDAALNAKDVAETEKQTAEKERDTANDVARTREEQLVETEKQRDEAKEGLNQASVIAGRVIAERDELVRLLEDGTDEDIAAARKKLRAARKAKRKAKKAAED